jgi:hypothetical protein
MMIPLVCFGAINRRRWVWGGGSVVGPRYVVEFNNKYPINKYFYFEPLFQEHLSMVGFKIFFPLLCVVLIETSFVVNQSTGPTVPCACHQAFVVLLKS